MTTAPRWAPTTMAAALMLAAACASPEADVEVMSGSSEDPNEGPAGAPVSCWSNGEYEGGIPVDGGYGDIPADAVAAVRARAGSEARKPPPERVEPASQEYEDRALAKANAYRNVEETQRTDDVSHWTWTSNGEEKARVRVERFSDSGWRATADSFEIPSDVCANERAKIQSGNR